MVVDIYSRTSQDGISLAELDLYHAIVDYRESVGLGALPLSKALSATAGRHVLDTRENIWAAGLDLPAGTNLHSWSDAPYYADARDPTAMWEAPARLGTGYPSSGYEISAAGIASGDAALAGWKSSAGHNAVLTETGGFDDIGFRAIGVGLDTSAGEGPYGGSVAHVWFGTAVDPTGVPGILGTRGADRFATTDFDDIAYGFGGNDRVAAGAGDDLVRGGTGGDILRGGPGTDRLLGDGGGDRLIGGTGRDILLGGTGADHLTGGTGADRLAPGFGADVLFGGAGRDVFVFGDPAQAGAGSGRDTILGFANGDRIDLSGMDADTSSRGNQAFTFIGDDRFSGEAGELRARAGLVQGDIDGDGRSDFSIALAGGVVAGADDFIL
jgi:Ca2+-binding RTX toxin-like protein